MVPTPPVLVRLMAVLLLKQQVTGLLTDPFVENGGTVVLPAPENAANVSVFCQVSFQGGTQTLTQWHLTMKGGMREVLAAGPSIQLTGGTLQTNLTIVSFSRDLDMAILECDNGFDGPNEETAFFLLRIIESPVLSSEPTPIIVVENNVFTFNISQSLGYPPDPSENSERATLTYQWFHDGVAINTNTSTNPNVSVYPEITFNPVVRTQSGNYSMTASTEGGDSTGYFILDVHYPVNANTGVNNQFCAPVGDSVTLVAHVNITGNPVPGSVWMFNGVTARGDPVVSGQLTITNPTPADSGNYTNTLNNTLNDGNTSSINRTVELRVQTPPSAPRTLTDNITEDSSTSGILQWQNPSDSGLPAFNKFVIELVSMSPLFLNISRTVTATSTDPSYINTFTVTGLKPNTNYTASVRAVSSLIDVSCMEQGVDLSGPLSNEVSFMTQLGDPEFSSASVENIAGKLNVIWGFRHTGGAPLTRVMVSCVSTDEDSGDGGLTQTIDCTGNSLCGNVSNDGMVSLPSGSDNVTAGMNYSCTVAATNMFASLQQATNYMVATSGVPSLPVINHVIASTFGVSLIVQLQYAGHPSMITVVISAGNEGGNNVTFVQSTAVSSNLNNYVFELSLPPGVYRFIVHASNTFGSTGWSKVFPSIGLNGFQVIYMDISTSATATTSTNIATPVITCITLANNAVGIGLSSTLGVCLIIIAVQFAALLITCVYIRKVHEAAKGKARTRTQADMQYETVDTHGQQPSIELQSNAAYASWVK